MMYQHQNRYLETAVQTATPSQLLIMLYDGAIRFTKHGIEAIIRGQFDEANQFLCRAQDVIHELMMTLDDKASISESLKQLYDYFIRRLIDANLKKDIVPAEEVLTFLGELKETWIQAAKLATMESAGMARG